MNLVSSLLLLDKLCYRLTAGSKEWVVGGQFSCKGGGVSEPSFVSDILKLLYRTYTPDFKTLLCIP